jgi:Eukaryotic integral membrane protein (DUF1751)
MLRNSGRSWPLCPNEWDHPVPHLPPFLLTPTPRVPFLCVFVVQLLFSIFAILLLAKVIEPIWGSKEFLKFIGIVNVGAGMSTFIIVVVAYALDRNVEGKLL